MLLKPAPVSHRQFTYDPATLTFSAEISETHGFGRVYDDSCDDGLTVIGKTGREVVFVVSREQRDAEGDIQSWHLLSVNPAGFAMTIWND